MNTMPPENAPSSLATALAQQTVMDPTEVTQPLSEQSPTASQTLPAKPKPIMPLRKDISATDSSPVPLTASPVLAAHTYGSPAPRPSTPNMHSAASSMIFERNVQEPASISDIAPAIPAHIKTEDLIPPALDSSSLAITDDHLSPEEVEIVTHVTHQPAATTIAQNITSTHKITSGQASETSLPLASQDSHEQHIFHTQSELDEAGASYGTLDPNDVRRLSFISFADVVHGDHSIPPPGLPHETSFSQTSSASRPISPVRSPATPTSQSFSALASPPTTASIPGSGKALEAVSPHSLDPSPLATSPQLHGELAIETLSQALRKTASRDLGGINRSPPPSSAA